MREVDAVIYGPFGIHRTILGLHDFDRRSFTVSHVATGYATSTDATSKASALKLARMLVRCGVNWDFTKAPMRPNNAQRARDVVARWSALQGRR
jgi:hypothetical protein